MQTGDRVGLVGANGGGKTTQLRILSGVALSAASNACQQLVTHLARVL